MKNKTEIIEEEIIYKKAKIHNKSQKPQQVKVVYSAPQQETVEVVEVIEPASYVELPVKEYIVESQPRYYGIEQVELIDDVKPVRVQPARVVREEIIEERVVQPQVFELDIIEDSGAYDLYPKREMRILEP